MDQHYVQVLVYNIMLYVHRSNVYLEHQLHFLNLSAKKPSGHLKDTHIGGSYLKDNISEP